MKNLTLFTKSASNNSNDSSSHAIAKEFIAELNNNNSGITDCLCKLVSAVIRDDQVTTTSQDASSTMSNEFLDLITDAIATLETNFVENILSDITLSENDKIMVRKATRIFQAR